MDPIARIQPQSHANLFRAATLRQDIAPREIAREKSTEESNRADSQSPKEGAQVSEVKREVKGSLDVEA